MNTGAIILYIATSVDGFIADEDGGVEWLEHFQEDTGDEADAGSYEDFFASIECLVMGSTTYEQVLTFGEWPYENKPTYVFTHRNLDRATDAIELYEGEIDPLADQLRDQYESIWLVGGAQLAQSFLRENQIDELRVSLVPVLLGRGIPLFSPTGDRHQLHLRNTASYGSGIVELQYGIQHP